MVVLCLQKNADKQGKIISDPVSYKDLHANQRSNQISNKTIGTSLSKYVFEDSTVYKIGLLP